MWVKCRINLGKNGKSKTFLKIQKLIVKLMWAKLVKLEWAKK